MFLIHFFILLFMLSACGPSMASSSVTTEQRVYGITIDDISNLSQTMDAIKSLPYKMTVRVVFDLGMEASYYKSAVTQLHTVAYVQGELLDSFFVKDLSTQEYLERTKSYLDTLGESVDIWEIGNEINGSWTLNQNGVSEVVDKIEGAYDLVKQRGYKTALTFYYNGTYNNGIPSADNCWSIPEEQMFEWIDHNVSNTLQNGLDFVWVSFYEEDCEQITPDWYALFSKLSSLFPNAKVGIGEFGLQTTLGGVTGGEASLLERYYSMMNLSPYLPRFVWGDFWWFFIRDMVPKTKPLWNSLSTILKTPPLVGDVAFITKISVSKGLVTGDLESLHLLDETLYSWTDKKIVQIDEQSTQGASIQADLSLPSTINLQTPKGLIFKISFASAAYSTQKWYWDIYDFSKKSWVRFGNNSGVINGQWNKQTFRISSNLSNYISTSKTVRIRLSTPQTANPKGSALDWLLLQIEY